MKIILNKNNRLKLYNISLESSLMITYLKTLCEALDDLLENGEVDSDLWNDGWDVVFKLIERENE